MAQRNNKGVGSVLCAMLGGRYNVCLGFIDEETEAQGVTAGRCRPLSCHMSHSAAHSAALMLVGPHAAQKDQPEGIHPESESQRQGEVSRYR